MTQIIKNYESLNNFLCSVTSVSTSWFGGRQVHGIGPNGTMCSASLDVIAKKVAEAANRVLQQEDREPPRALYTIIRQVETLYNRQEENWGILTHIMVWICDRFNSAPSTLHKVKKNLNDAYPIIKMEQEERNLLRDGMMVPWDLLQNFQDNAPLLNAIRNRSAHELLAWNENTFYLKLFPEYHFTVGTHAEIEQQFTRLVQEKREGNEVLPTDRMTTPQELAFLVQKHPIAD